MHEAMRAKLSPDVVSKYMNLTTGLKPNIKLLKNAVERLCLATTQNTAGQRPDDTPDMSVNWRSPEIDLIHYIILCEAVVLVLSGALDGLESDDID